jgi:hypothetical protein
MKVHRVAFQLKGSDLLWWKTLLPHLNMAINDVSWELIRGTVPGEVSSEEFIERQLHEFNAL